MPKTDKASLIFAEAVETKDKYTSTIQELSAASQEIASLKAQLAKEKEKSKDLADENALFHESLEGISKMWHITVDNSKARFETLWSSFVEGLPVSLMKKLDAAIFLDKKFDNPIIHSGAKREVIEYLEAGYNNTKEENSTYAEFHAWLYLFYNITSIGFNFDFEKFESYFLSQKSPKKAAYHFSSKQTEDDKESILSCKWVKTAKLDESEDFKYIVGTPNRMPDLISFSDEYSWYKIAIENGMIPSDISVETADKVERLKENLLKKWNKTGKGNIALSFLEWMSAILSFDNFKQLYIIPKILHESNEKAHFCGALVLPISSEQGFQLAESEIKVLVNHFDNWYFKYALGIIHHNEWITFYNLENSRNKHTYLRLERLISDRIDHSIEEIDNLEDDYKEEIKDNLEEIALLFQFRLRIAENTKKDVDFNRKSINRLLKIVFNAAYHDARLNVLVPDIIEIRSRWHNNDVFIEKSILDIENGFSKVKIGSGLFCCLIELLFNALKHSRNHSFPELRISNNKIYVISKSNFDSETYSWLIGKGPHPDKKKEIRGLHIIQKEILKRNINVDNSIIDSLKFEIKV